HEDRAEALVALQVGNAVPPGAHDLTHPARREHAELRIVLRRLDDDLVRADPAHAVVDAFAASLEVALDPQRGKFVGDDAHAPRHADPPARPGGGRTRTGGGVSLSRPAQKTQEPLRRSAGACAKSVGRRTRSVAMITQRPASGSLRSSGIPGPRAAARPSQRA